MCDDALQIYKSEKNFLFFPCASKHFGAEFSCSCSFADPFPPRNFIKWNFMLRGLARSARAALFACSGREAFKDC